MRNNLDSLHIFPQFHNSAIPQFHNSTIPQFHYSVNKNSILFYMKYINNKSNNKIQRGGQDTIGDTLSSSNTGSSAISTPSKELPGPIKRLPYDVKIFSFLCIMGILVKIIFGNASSDYATATVWGYGFSILALFGLLVGSFGISYKDGTASTGTIGFLKVIFKNALPILLNISIIALIIVQNVSFYKQINSGKVADEYYQFSGVSSFLILVQSVLVIKYLMDILAGEQSKSADKSSILASLASELNSVILILSVMNIGIIGLLQVILKYFSTDG